MSRHGQDFIDVGFTGLSPWTPVAGHVELSRTHNVDRTHNVEEAEVHATRIIEDPLADDLAAEAERAVENYGLELTMKSYGELLTPLQRAELAQAVELTSPATLAEADAAAREAVERDGWADTADERGELF